LRKSSNKQRRRVSYTQNMMPFQNQTPEQSALF
jgi:hypothetical protein